MKRISDMRYRMDTRTENVPEFARVAVEHPTVSGADEVLRSVFDALGESPEALRGFLCCCDEMLTLASTMRRLGMEFDGAEFTMMIVTMLWGVTCSPQYVAALALDEREAMP
jgi:hypothetical protein